jgi:hypothetical protein
MEGCTYPPDPVPTPVTKKSFAFCSVFQANSQLGKKKKYVTVSSSWHLGVEGESCDALPVLEVVCGEVLAAGGGLQVRGVDRAGHAVALHAANEDGGVLAGHRRVLTGGLLAPAPSRVSEDVDVWRPEGEPLGLTVVVHRPRLHADHLLNGKISVCS